MPGVQQLYGTPLVRIMMLEPRLINGRGKSRLVCQDSEDKVT